MCKKLLVKIDISDHGWERIRERWPVATMSDEDIKAVVTKNVLYARRTGDVVSLTGGDYHFFSHAGVDGFAVLRANTVATFMPMDMCPDVARIRREKGYV